MPDISKCMNEKCPQKETCWRWTSIADTYQSYAFFEFDEDGNCEFIMKGEIMNKICKQCLKEFPKTKEFFYLNKKINSLSSDCKTCYIKKTKERQNKKAKEININDDIRNRVLGKAPKESYVETIFDKLKSLNRKLNMLFENLEQFNFNDKTKIEFLENCIEEFQKYKINIENGEY